MEMRLSIPANISKKSLLKKGPLPEGKGCCRLEISIIGNERGFLHPLDGTLPDTSIISNSPPKLIQIKAYLYYPSTFRSVNIKPLKSSQVDSSASDKICNPSQQGRK